MIGQRYTPTALIPQKYSSRPIHWKRNECGSSL